MSLPSGYTQLEWIQSTGTQYIDSGVNASNSVGFEIDFETTSAISATGFGTIFGCINSGTNRYNLGTYPDESGGQLTFGSNVYNPYLSTSTRLLLSLRGTNLTTPNGVQTVSGSFSVGATITVFARKRVDGTIDEYSKTKLYYFKLYSDTTVVRDFQPARRNSDNAVGLYDLQNGVFYTNGGSGSIVAGPEVKYTALSYIESSGTQYINTRFVPDKDTRTVMTGKMLPHTGNGSLFGVRTSAASNLYTMTWVNNDSEFLSNYGTGYTTVPFTVGNEFSLDKNKNTTTMNGTVYSDAYESFTCPGPMYLFATNANGSLLHYGVFRLYSCQIYDNGTLVRDFIPAMRNSDGAIGLLDQANNVFYANAGTGTFVAGPEIASTGSLANVGGTSVLLNGCLANVGGIECAIPYALANVDGIEVVIPFGEAYETIDAVPYQTGTLTYTGSALSPTWAGYDESTLTIGGTTSATNAGTYTATFTPADGYVWADTMEAETRSVNWAIGKAAGKVTLSKTSISLQAGSSTTFTVSRSGDGAISIKNSASVTNYSATLTGTTVTVGANGVGSGTITVSVAEGTNHLAASASCTVVISMPTYTISIGRAKDAYAALSLAYFEVGGTQYDGSLNTTVTVTEGTSWTAYSRKYGVSGGITVDGTHKGWGSVTGTVTSNMKVNIGVYYNANTPYMTSVTITTS